ncbi:MAG: cyanophycin synthetase [Candidatus Saccharibacteria bacterium]|nr:cyanophycin synthetase [Candidatus Saccharibacteria bacterium]
MTIVSKFKKKFYFVAAGYFKFFANISLKRWHPRIIVVTGSAGKTTMLNLIESQLGAKAHYSHNANSAFGIAFDILGMRGITGSKWKWASLIFRAPLRAFSYRHHEPFYIVECDGERPHEAEFIAKWLKPEVSCWVSLGRSHAVFFENEVKEGKFDNVDEAIAHEFSTIPQNTRKLVLIDGESAKMYRCTENIKAKVVSVDHNDLQGYEVFPDKAVFDFGKHKFVFHEPMPRDVTVQLLMLKELMDYLDEDISYSLDNFQMPPARCNFLHGKKGIKIIDSSYNAHIISMTTVLDMVKELQAENKWLVIGDIIDQGKLEGEEHEKLAKLLLDTKVKNIVMIGRRTKKYTYPLLKDKVKNVHSFDKPQQALKYLEENLTGKETVIFKGSQYLEWIVEKLLDDPRDVDKLARQDEAHRRRRASWGLN